MLHNIKDFDKTSISSLGVKNVQICINCADILICYVFRWVFVRLLVVGLKQALLNPAAASTIFFVFQALKKSTKRIGFQPQCQRLHLFSLLLTGCQRQPRLLAVRAGNHGCIFIPATFSQFFVLGYYTTYFVIFFTFFDLVLRDNSAYSTICIVRGLYYILDV